MSFEFKLPPEEMAKLELPLPPARKVKPMSGMVRELRASAGDRVVRDEQIRVFASPVGLSAAIRAGSEDVDQLKLKLASLDARIQTFGSQVSA